jgi:hypothetical protein
MVLKKLMSIVFQNTPFPISTTFIRSEGRATAELLTAEKKTYCKVSRMMAHAVNNSSGPGKFHSPASRI